MKSLAAQSGPRVCLLSLPNIKHLPTPKQEAKVLITHKEGGQVLPTPKKRGKVLPTSKKEENVLPGAELRYPCYATERIFLL